VIPFSEVVQGGAAAPEQIRRDHRKGRGKTGLTVTVGLRYVDTLGRESGKEICSGCELLTVAGLQVPVMVIK